MKIPWFAYAQKKEFVKGNLSEKALICINHSFKSYLSNKDKLIYPVSSKLVTSFITKFTNNDFLIPSNNIRINAFENKIT